MKKQIDNKHAKTPVKQAGTRQPGIGLMLLLLMVVISLLLGGGYLPGRVQFSNDGPLGRLVAQCHHLPDRFTGCWDDLNFLGYSEGAALPGIGFGLQYLLKPVIFSKLYAPVGLLILGLGAWCFFRQLGLAPLACILGGLAATLNSGFFSVACWGIAAHPITVGLSFFAMAALADTTSPRRWLRVVLAGLAVGMGVTEGADVGAIFSLFVATFIAYQTLITEGPRGRTAATGLGRLMLVMIFAFLLASQAISQLVATNVEDMSVGDPDATNAAQRWDWATQWSLSKREAFSLVVPGLFGYRMDTPHGGSYWGLMGRDAAWEQYVASGENGTPPKGLKRFTGSGFYCGVIVVVLAIWACLQSLRRKDSVFSQYQRKWIWFWIAIAVISLLLAFGRYAPFYHFVYELPYFSTIRNPVKYLYILSVALVVLFAYGVDALSRKYMPALGPKAAARWHGPTTWWAKADKFEKNWVLGCLVIFGFSLLAWWFYASSSQSLKEYMRSVQISDSMLSLVADFSIRQVGWFAVFFAVMIGLMVLMISGAFTGPRARWGGICLGLLLALDLGRANQPWILPVNYEEKYASNPVIDSLRGKPYEHRVAMLPFPVSQQLSLFLKVYQLEWAQHHFPYYNIESLNIVQMSRYPKDIAAFRKVMDPIGSMDPSPRLARYWQITNTRYLLGAASFLDVLNQQVSPEQGSFRIQMRFNLTPKPGVVNATDLTDLTAVPDPGGPMALFEFTAALPRAKLFSNWQVETNDQAALDKLVSASFDPQKSVLVAGGTPAMASGGGASRDAGTVEFASYKPKDIILTSKVVSPSVLLLNDHYDSNWKVSVDGRPETVLRCNYLMRGVFLNPGEHTVEFRYEPPIRLLYVSLAAIGLSVPLLAFVVTAGYRRNKPKVDVTPTPSIPVPVTDKGTRTK